MSEASVRRLLDGVVSVAQDLSLPDVLHRIVLAARDLADARYGALGVIGPEGGLTEFIGVGTDDETRAAIGPLPTGQGILGLLIDQPRPLRLPDLREHPAASGFPPGHPPMRSFLGVPIRVRDTVFGNLYLTDKRGGGEFTQHDEDVVVALAAAAGVAIQNATLFERTRLRERWLAASQEVTATLLGGEDPEAALRLIAERARAVSGATVGAIARPDEDRPGTLVFDIVETAGAVPQPITGLSVSTEGTATGEAFTTGKAIVVRDYGAHVADYQQERTDARLPAIVAQLDSAVAVPLTVGSNTLGVLLVAKVGDAPPFGDDEVELVQTFAAQAALALEFGRAARDRERLAVFEDRERIAHDLHDLVIQRLFAIGLGLEGLGRLTSSPRIAEQVSGFVHELDRTIRDIRNSIFSLQDTDPAEGPGGLRSELLRVVLDTSPALGFEPRISFEGPLDTAVPSAVRPDVVATLREALSNTARHAAATEVSVTVALDRGGRTLSVSVTDNGAGMPARPGRRSGLANLAERAARWLGRLTLTPAAGGGTVLNWTVSLPRPGGRS
ncbi:histidine kinase [Prauserella muralis]|uniref:Histidine kinase n=1 Tax=Prauserella muralis TaxID=588067 RepID=A0A2V4B376_9PSEU|nr:GAF domain-containing protein [Prauserella muralis]PXY22915.1 histidine kinase [Prauserella muralis]